MTAIGVLPPVSPRVESSAAAQVEDRSGCDVTVIVVTWNSEADIARCLGSIQDNSGGRRTEVIVVDNASSDRTVNIIRESFPETILITCASNLGFPRANNLGIRAARGRFVLLLNPDTEVHPGTLEKCVSRMEEDLTIGLAGCRILYPDGRLQHECAYHLPEIRDPLLETLYLHMLFPRSRIFGRHRMSYWDHLSDKVVPCISGAFMLARMEMIRKIGPLDERFFMYFEDFEYCARAARSGWKVQYISEPTIIHYAGRSRAQSKVEFDFLVPIIRYAYFLEYRGATAAIAFRVLCFVQATLRFGIAVVGRGLLWWSPGLLSRPALRPKIHLGRVQWALGVRSFSDVISPRNDDGGLAT